MHQAVDAAVQGMSVIVRLEDADYQSALTQAEASLAEAKAALASVACLAAFLRAHADPARLPSA